MCGPLDVQAQYLPDGFSDIAKRVCQNHERALQVV